MAELQVTYSLTRKDFFWYILQSNLSRRSIQLGFLLLYLFAFSVSFNFSEISPDTTPLMEGLRGLRDMVVITIILIIFLGFRGSSSAKGKGILGEHTITLTEDDLIEETVYNKSFCKWNGILKIVTSRRYLAVHITEQLIHLIPRRAFQSLEAAQAFEDFIKAKIAANSKG